MILYSTRGYQKSHGLSTLRQECQHCHNTVQYELNEHGSKFALFFIPIFSFNRKYHLQCPICHYGYDIKKEDLAKYQIDSE